MWHAAWAVSGLIEFVRMCDVAAGNMQVGLVLGIILLYLSTFTRTISFLNKTLKSAKRNVLLFPEDVILGVPAVRALVREFTRSNQSRVSTM